MPPPVIDLSDERFGRLVVEGMVEKKVKNRATYWLCRCDCGRLVEVRGDSLRQENTVRCGRDCLLGEYKQVYRKRVYRIWRGMLRRCYDQKHVSYRWYGAKGVTVCERWRDRYKGLFAFMEDMGDPPPDTSIDRIDHHGHYEPGNCRWATREEQDRNRSDNHFIECGGKNLCVADWARELGIDHRTIHARLARGWTDAEALGVPVHGKRPALKTAGKILEEEEYEE